MTAQSGTDKGKPQGEAKPGMGQKPQSGGCCGGSQSTAKPSKPQGGCCN